MRVVAGGKERARVRRKRGKKVEEKEKKEGEARSKGARRKNRGEEVCEWKEEQSGEESRERVDGWVRL